MTKGEGMEPTTTYVFIAGITNSGPDHWQSRWYRRLENAVWVDHKAWDRPIRDLWVRDLDEAIKPIAGPKLLIAHSLGCTLVAEWALQHADAAIAGAFLVAPPDVNGSQFPPEVVGFDTLNYVQLPFKTVVVASEDDPYGSLEHSTAVADRLGARLAAVGRKGHLNTESGLGNWHEGWTLLCDHLRC
jgi:uncharacterized protein